MRDVKTQSVHEDLVRGMHEKIEANSDDIVEVDSHHVESADTVVVSFGITSRTADGAVERLRERGLDIGHLRLKTVWPFPDDEISEATAGATNVFVPEMNLGQVAREVERVSETPVTPLERIGGEPWTVSELVEAMGGEH